MILFYAVAIVLTAGTVEAACTTREHVRYRRCVRSIERLELSTGIVQPPPDFADAYIATARFVNSRQMEAQKARQTIESNMPWVEQLFGKDVARAERKRWLGR